METFERFKKNRAFERRYLSALKTCEDFDIVVEVGYAEEQGRPLTVKQLLLLKLGSPSTIRRRLAHLRQAGVIRQRRAPDDSRVALLELDGSVHRTFRHYVRLASN
jgi:hypothetical protein